jgi:hypothetical protein
VKEMEAMRITIQTESQRRRETEEQEKRFGTREKLPYFARQK